MNRITAIHPHTMAELSQLYVGVYFYDLSPRERSVVSLLMHHGLLGIHHRTGIIED